MAKQITVVERTNLQGLSINPPASVEGTRHEVSLKAVLEAAAATGIENYVSRIQAGKRVNLKPNNKVLAPAIRALYGGESKPNAEVNSVDKPKDPRFVKGTPEAKAYMASIRNKRNGKKDAQEQNTELVLDRPESSLDAAIASARERGKWELLELLVDQKHS